MYKKLYLYIVFAFITANIQSINEPMLPKTIQLSFVSQKDKTSQVEASPEILYCVEALQNIAYMQQKRPLTLEEIIMTIKILVYLHTNNSPFRQGIIVTIDDKTITLPFSKQLFAEIIQEDTKEEDSDNDDEEES